MMMKLQEEINNLLTKQESHKHDEAKYLKKELREMNMNFSHQIQSIQKNIE